MNSVYMPYKGGAETESFSATCANIILFLLVNRFKMDLEVILKFKIFLVSSSATKNQIWKKLPKKSVHYNGPAHISTNAKVTL